MFVLELYIWAMVVTTVACVRPREAGDLAEWACASLAGAIWPVTVCVRIHRAMRRGCGMGHNEASSKGHSFLPCPFCGSERLDTQTFSYVICDKCGAFGPSPGDGRSGAELWNQRAEVRRG